MKSLADIDLELKALEEAVGEPGVGSVRLAKVRTVRNESYFDTIIPHPESPFPEQ